jgi:hypothetical protein
MRISRAHLVDTFRLRPSSDQPVFHQKTNVESSFNIRVLRPLYETCCSARLDAGAQSARITLRPSDRVIKRRKPASKAIPVGMAPSAQETTPSNEVIKIMKWPVSEDRNSEGLTDATYRADSNGTYPLIKPTEGHVSTLKQRIASTVRAAQAQRNLELQQAADRAKAERQDVLDKAKAALLFLLSDDTIALIIGKHAALGELNVGAIKITKQGVELIRSGGAVASHMVGERLNVRFDGAILQAGKQLISPEFESRVAELLAQGVRIEASYDASVQGLLITFDYEKAIS